MNWGSTCPLSNRSNSRYSSSHAFQVLCPHAAQGPRPLSKIARATSIAAPSLAAGESSSGGAPSPVDRIVADCRTPTNVLHALPSPVSLVSEHSPVGVSDSQDVGPDSDSDSAPNSSNGGSAGANAPALHHDIDFRPCTCSPPVVSSHGDEVASTSGSSHHAPGHTRRRRKGTSTHHHPVPADDLSSLPSSSSSTSGSSSTAGSGRRGKGRKNHGVSGDSSNDGTGAAASSGLSDDDDDGGGDVSAARTAAAGTGSSTARTRNWASPPAFGPNEPKEGASTSGRRAKPAKGTIDEEAEGADQGADTGSAASTSAPSGEASPPPPSSSSSSLPPLARRRPRSNPAMRERPAPSVEFLTNLHPPLRKAGLPLSLLQARLAELAALLNLDGPAAAAPLADAVPALLLTEPSSLRAGLDALVLALIDPGDARAACMRAPLLLLLPRDRVGRGMAELCSVVGPRCARALVRLLPSVLTYNPATLAAKLRGLQRLLVAASGAAAGGGAGPLAVPAVEEAEAGPGGSCRGGLGASGISGEGEGAAAGAGEEEEGGPRGLGRGSSESAQAAPVPDCSPPSASASCTAAAPGAVAAAAAAIAATADVAIRGGTTVAQACGTSGARTPAPKPASPAADPAQSPQPGSPASGPSASGGAMSDKSTPVPRPRRPLDLRLVLLAAPALITFDVSTLERHYWGLVALLGGPRLHAALQRHPGLLGLDPGLVGAKMIQLRNRLDLVPYPHVVQNLVSKEPKILNSSKLATRRRIAALSIWHLPPRFKARMFLARPGLLLLPWREVHGRCRWLRRLMLSNGYYHSALRRLPPQVLAVVVEAVGTAWSRLQFLAESGQEHVVRLVEAVTCGQEAFEARFPGYGKWFAWKLQEMGCDNPWRTGEERLRGLDEVYPFEKKPRAARHHTQAERSPRSSGPTVPVVVTEAGEVRVGSATISRPRRVVHQPVEQPQPAQLLTPPASEAEAALKGEATTTMTKPTEATAAAVAAMVAAAAAAGLGPTRGPAASGQASQDGLSVDGAAWEATRPLAAATGAVQPQRRKASGRRGRELRRGRAQGGREAPAQASRPPGPAGRQRQRP